MDLSIVIVNFRAWEKLANCLNALATTPWTIKHEVIVVDNQSGDGKLDDFSQRFPTIRFIANNGNNGFANGCNLGAEHSSGSQLLFLNPDTEASPAALCELHQYLQLHADIGILSCHQLDGKQRQQKAFGHFPNFITNSGLLRALAQKLAPTLYPNPRGHYSAPLDVDWVSGSVVMIRRETFERLGRWDDAFWMYSEDMDLSKRCHNAGLRVVYHPNITITHLHGGASRSSSEVTALTKTEVW